jgi:hypothetical protein
LKNNEEDDNPFEDDFDERLNNNNLRESLGGN